MNGVVVVVPIRNCFLRMNPYLYHHKDTPKSLSIYLYIYIYIYIYIMYVLYATIQITKPPRCRKSAHRCGAKHMSKSKV